MKFLSLFFATGIAASVLPRDLATVQGVLANVATDLDGLNTATKGFNGDPTDLLDASNKVIQTIKDGDAKVQSQPALTLNEALGLTGPAKDLQTKGDALLASIKDKKAAIAAAGLCDVTLLQVTDLKTASDALIKTVVSKVPPAAQSIAQGLVAPLQKDLAEAKDLFSPANCQNGGGGGNPTAQPTSTSAPTSTKPPGTTSAPTSTKPPGTTSAPTSTKPPGTTSAPTVAPTTSTGTTPTTTNPGPGNGTCPAASTVTVTSTDTKDCTPTPTCTKTAPVTVTTTTKACPTGSKLPW